MTFFRNKFDFGFYPLAAVWGFYLLTAVALIGGVSINIMHFLFESHSLDPGYLDIIFWPLLLFLILQFVWYKNVFTRWDFIKLAKQNEIVLTSQPWIVSIFTRAFWSILRGRLGNIYVIAKLGCPFIEPVSFGCNTLLTTDLLDTANNVSLFLLINGDIENNISIFINDENRELPQTGIQEIDCILHDSLEGVNDFRAALTINKQLICLTVIGGVWFGRRFQERIVKGLEIARKLEVIKSKYTYETWDGYEMKWDFESKNFLFVKGTADNPFQ